MKIETIGEFGLIAQIDSKFRSLTPQTCIGIGDDCAVIPFGTRQSMVVTTDMLIEDVHFTRHSISAFQLGYKSLAVNLSDIAAMGATPHSSFLSIALPLNVDGEWSDQFTDGFRAHNIALLGGDTTKSLDKIAISVTAIGLIDNESLKLRSGAKVGDSIWITARLGDSAGGLRAIFESLETEYPTLVNQHFMPRPHLSEGQWLGRQETVTSMMDISDGVASDLKHILRASQVGARVELTSIPLSGELVASPWNALELALTGGEDYCLLFTASPEFEPNSEYEMHRIGTITANNTAEITWLQNGCETLLDYHGFTHF